MWLCAFYVVLCTWCSLANTVWCTLPVQLQYLTECTAVTSLPVCTQRSWTPIRGSLPSARSSTGDVCIGLFSQLIAVASVI
jgi:hypothetical protein